MHAFIYNVGILLQFSKNVKTREVAKPISRLMGLDREGGCAAFVGESAFAVDGSVQRI